jgi:hypothetical protein
VLIVLGLREGIQEQHGLIKIALGFLHSVGTGCLLVGQVQRLHRLVFVPTPSIVIRQHLVVFFQTVRVECFKGLADALVVLFTLGA